MNSDSDCSFDIVGSNNESESDSDSKTGYTWGTQKGRRNIRSVKKVDELSSSTKLSNLNEDERIKRIEELKKKFQTIQKDDENQLILDYDFINNCPLVSVHKTLVSKLKGHQKEGVKFMWDACFESVEQIEKSDGSGCILAHCMGLGKTLQVVTLVHTLLCHKVTKVKTVLICCPKNTLLNWVNEFDMWITPDMDKINVYNPTRFEDHESKSFELSTWQLGGGVCVMNYELFRILLEEVKKNTKQFPSRLREKFQQHLLNPGPDLIVCDEGHILKNEDTKLSKIMSKIKTMRRIVLTGTPMQNNLVEYHCMIQFVKPFLLGTKKEFLNMFVNPISNGQYENSLVQDVRLMKQRSHILHKKLIGCVQRFDLSVLKKYLPEKVEYVLSVPLTDCQIDMYRFYLENYSAKGDPKWKNEATQLFADYQALQRIWTHPYVSKLYEDKYLDMLRQESKNKKKKKKKKKQSEEYDSEDMSDTDSFYWTRYPLSWWNRFASFDTIEDVRQSNKLILLLKILKECEDVNEKVLLFSVSLYSLNMIEHFLKRINRSEFENANLCNMTSTWEENEDYVILTGQTSSKDRDLLCKRFNNTNDTRLRLFLISTKAGGMGINLTAANRAILFDVSWNPSHDTQSTFRIYRMGQMKPCFIYRFVASGTMEEKMYGRQVAKQSISHRVVDEMETARHFSRTELLELYKLEPYKRQPFNIEELKDPILRTILHESSDIVYGIHEHDSLLEHKEDEELEEMEKNNAWTAFKKDINGKPKNLKNESDKSIVIVPETNNTDFDELPDDIKKMLEELKPEDFDPFYLKKVIEYKNPELTEIEIENTVSEMMPQIQDILHGPNFINIMKEQALLAQKSDKTKKKRPPQRKRRKSTANNSIVVLDKSKENDDGVIIELVTKRVQPNVVDLVSSDSEDSVFRAECFKKKRRSSLKPLKAWGARNGKEYGTPDTE